MVAGFHDESDPNVSPSQFDKFPQGEVVVSGIYSYVYLDEVGSPFYKERDGRPQTMLKLRMADGSEGPPMSATPAELALLVIAFAGEQYVSKLPAMQTSAQYLLTAKQIVNCEAEEQRGKVPARQTACVSASGYVRSLTGMGLPTDRMFRFVLEDIRNIDGTTAPLRFIEHPSFRQAVLSMRFRVAGDMMGNKTIYDGAPVNVLMENPFDGVYEGTNAEGLTIRSPKLKVNSNHSRPMAVSRLLNFINIFCPELADEQKPYEWVSDPLRSSYGTDEAANPIIVIADHALRGGRQGLGKMEISEKSKRRVPKLDLASLMAVEGGTAPVAETHAPDALEILYATVERLVQKAKGTAAFKPNSVEWTDEGKEWAQDKLKTIWDFLNLPQPRVIGNLDLKQATALNSMLLGLESQAAPAAAADPNLNKPTSEF
jgi:hypothetical protein